MVLVFDFGLGQRGAVMNAPVEPASDPCRRSRDRENRRTRRAITDSYCGLMVRYGSSQRPKMPRRLKFGPLKIDILRRVLAAFGADLRGRHRGFAFAEFGYRL